VPERTGPEKVEKLMAYSSNLRPSSLRRSLPSQSAGCGEARFVIG